MAKTKDITPQFRLMTAEEELAMPFVQESMGMSMGGLSMYSNSFKRGYGDNVFGSNEQGIWLGAADYENAPLKMGMDGKINISGSNGVNSSLLTEKGLILYKNDLPQVVIAII